MGFCTVGSSFLLDGFYWNQTSFNTQGLGRGVLEEPKMRRDPINDRPFWESSQFCESQRRQPHLVIIQRCLSETIGHIVVRPRISFKSTGQPLLCPGHFCEALSGPNTRSRCVFVLLKTPRGDFWNIRREYKELIPNARARSLDEAERPNGKEHLQFLQV